MFAALGFVNMLSTSLCMILLASILYLQPTQGHFTLQGSREQAFYPDNRRFWPIAVGSQPGVPPNGVLRPIRDCASLPIKTVFQFAPNSLQQLRFEIGNGANHVGMCTATININGQTTKSSSEDNCVSKPGSFMNVAIPNYPVGTSGYIKMKVTAVHIPTAPEYYDSCIDFVIVGSSSSVPIAPTPKPAPKPAPMPAPMPVVVAPESYTKSNSLCAQLGDKCDPFSVLDSLRCACGNTNSKIFLRCERSTSSDEGRYKASDLALGTKCVTNLKLPFAIDFLK
jgi:hypothetical protein